MERHPDFCVRSDFNPASGPGAGRLPPCTEPGSVPNLPLTNEN